MMVVLRCPRCHKRYTVDYDEWCKTLLPGAKKMACNGYNCEKKELVYHKDA